MSIGAEAVPRLRSRSRLVAGSDAPGWSAGFAFAPFGGVVGARTNHPACLETLHALLLPNGCDPVAAPTVDALLSLWHAEAGADHLLVDHVKTVVRTPNLEEALRELRRRFHLHVAFTAPPRLLCVQAGVVEWRGRALVLPSGRSTGKSHLVAALVERGAGFVSDTFAVLGPDGRVRSYPTSLALWGGAAPRRLPAVAGGLEVGWVADLRYESDARLRASGPAAVAQSLFEATVTGLSRPSQAMESAARLARGAPGLAGRRGEADAAADALIDWMDRKRRP